MFQEQEVFAKIGFLVMALDASQRQVQQLSQALVEAQQPQVEESNESTGNEDGRSRETGRENA